MCKYFKNSVKNKNIYLRKKNNISSMNECDKITTDCKFLDKITSYLSILSFIIEQRST